MIRKTKMGMAVLWVFSLPFLLAFPVWAYEEVAVKGGGIVKGFVKVDREVPEPQALEISKYKEFCKDVPNESLIVGPDRGVRYAVVTLEGITRGKAVEREASNELDNRGCRFVPHVQAASVGQWLVLKNGDPILHTAHAFFEARGQPQFNVGLYPGRVSRKPLVSPGVVKILCEVHPWMRAYIVVTDHPYHAVTDIFGEYEIRDVPQGSYRLRVWHETLGNQEKEIKVRRGSVARVDVVFPSARAVKR